MLFSYKEFDKKILKLHRSFCTEPLNFIHTNMTHISKGNEDLTLFKEGGKSFYKIYQYNRYFQEN